MSSYTNLQDIWDGVTYFTNGSGAVGASENTNIRTLLGEPFSGTIAYVKVSLVRVSPSLIVVYGGAQFQAKMAIGFIIRSDNASLRWTGWVENYI